MSRVGLVQKDQATPEVKELFQRIEDNGAKVINLYRVVANSPHVVRNLIKLGNSIIGKTDLSPKLRELTIMRIARLCDCEYEWVQHTPIALHCGASQAQLDAIGSWKESDAFTDEERAVLQYVDEVARNVKVADKTFEALRQHLSEREIVELNLAIGWWGMLARLLVPLEVEIDAQSVGSVADLIGQRPAQK
ncbi:MAG: carboxymuconolactone decarboxylase family protein [Dehalococcoidia bacterium]|nr:carboxymuconolactone decarboxylase family protein [Dehalococcoidia bacterium]